MSNPKNLSLVLALMLASGNLTAQDNINVWKIPKDERTAGHELLIAQKNWHYGATLIGLGTGQILLGNQLEPGHPNDLWTSRRVFTYSGIAFNAVGLIWIIESWRHVGRAGRLMIKQSVSLGMDMGPTGATLTLKF